MPFAKIQIESLYLVVMSRFDRLGSCTKNDLHLDLMIRFSVRFRLDLCNYVHFIYLVLRYYIYI